MLEVSLGRSRRLQAALIAAHGGAALASWGAGLPLVLKFVLLPLLLASALHTLRKHVWRTSPVAVAGMHLGQDCTITLRLRNGSEVAGRALAGSVVSPFLTVLSVRAEGSRWPMHAVILPDAVNKEAFRKLRVRLRWKCAQQD